MTAKVSKKNSFSTLSYQVLWLGSGIRLPRTIPLGPLFCRFVYGSQIIHISKEDVLSFFGQSRTVVFDIISNEADKRTDRAVNMLRNLSSFQQSMHKFTSAIILFQTSHAAPIDLSELEAIMTFLVNNLVDKADIKYGLGMRDYLDNRIRLMVACN